MLCNVTSGIYEDENVINSYFTYYISKVVEGYFACYLRLSASTGV